MISYDNRIYSLPHIPYTYILQKNWGGGVNMKLMQTFCSVKHIFQRNKQNPNFHSTSFTKHDNVTINHSFHKNIGWLKVFQISIILLILCINNTKYPLNSSSGENTHKHTLVYLKLSGILNVKNKLTQNSQNQ